MRIGSLRVARTVAVLAVFPLLVTIGCCSSSDGIDQASPRLPLTVPILFSGAYGSYSARAATTSHIVGLGGSTPGPDGVDEVRYGGQSVDLASGRVSEIVGPSVGDLPVRVHAVAADDDQIISIGSVCEDPFPDGSCEPSTISAAMLDPTSGSWTDVALPEAVSVQSLTSVSLLQTIDDGSFVAVVRLRAEGQNHSMVLSFEGGRSTSLGEVDEMSLKSACATREWLFLLGAAPERTGGQGDGPTGTTVGFVMTKLDLSSGASVEVELPPLASAFGGAGIVMGCGPEAPTIASGALGGSTIVASYVDGEWQEFDGVLEGTDVVPGEVTNGPRGVLVGGYSLAATNTKEFSYAAIGEDQKVLRLDPGLLVDAESMWMGRTGSVIYLKTGETGRDSVPISITEIFS